MTAVTDLIAILRSCRIEHCVPVGCPMMYEERVAQDMYERRCAARDAACELERLIKADERENGNDAGRTERAPCPGKETEYGA